MFGTLTVFNVLLLCATYSCCVLTTPSLVFAGENDREENRSSYEAVEQSKLRGKDRTKITYHGMTMLFSQVLDMKSKITVLSRTQIILLIDQGSSSYLFAAPKSADNDKPKQIKTYIIER